MKNNFLAFVFGVAAVFLAFNLPTFDAKNFEKDLSASVSLNDSETSDIRPAPDIAIEAKAAYVFNVKENKPLFSLNENLQLPLASLAKIMTAIVAEENIPSYALIPVSKNAIDQEGDEGFITDERRPVSDLIDIMLISSSNDAAYALAEGFEGGTNGFVELMNKKAVELGLAQTHFFNATGLDVSKTQAGAYGSAKDIVNLLLYALKEKASLFEVTQYSALKIGSREFKNTNKIINEIPRIIFSKTGASDLAGGNLAVVVDKGFENYVIIVVMGSSEQGRFEDVKKLYQAI